MIKKNGDTEGKLSDSTVRRADGEKKLPREFINREGNFISEAFGQYAGPLIREQVDVEVGEDGLPVYVRLEKHMLDKKTPAYALK